MITKEQYQTARKCLLEMKRIQSIQSIVFDTWSAYAEPNNELYDTTTKSLQQRYKDTYKTYYEIMRNAFTQEVLDSKMDYKRGLGFTDLEFLEIMMDGGNVK